MSAFEGMSDPGLKYLAWCCSFSCFLKTYLSPFPSLQWYLGFLLSLSTGNQGLTLDWWIQALTLGTLMAAGVAEMTVCGPSHTDPRDKDKEGRILTSTWAPGSLSRSSRRPCHGDDTTYQVKDSLVYQQVVYMEGSPL